MPKSELDDWLIEDLADANVWIAERALRRQRERDKDIENKNVAPNAEEKARVAAVVKSQAESRQRAQAKHPELDFQKRLAELKEEGKSFPEAQAVISEENPKMKVVFEIVSGDPDSEEKYFLSPNGPELLMEEMEKRMGLKKDGKNGKKETEEERDQRLRDEGAEQEKERLAKIDADLHSNRNGTKPVDMSKDPMYQKQLALFRKGFPKDSEEQVKARLDNRLRERQLSGAV